MQADLAEIELVKTKAAGKQQSEAEADRRAGGEEDNCASPHLIKCFHKEQGYELWFIPLWLQPLGSCSSRQLINVLPEKKHALDPLEAPKMALSHGCLGIWWGILRSWVHFSRGCKPEVKKPPCRHRQFTSR